MPRDESTIRELRWRRGQNSGAPVGVDLPFDTSTPVVVLKLNRDVLHHGVLGVVRSFGRLGIPVYGMREDRLSPAASSRYLRGHSYPLPNAHKPDRVFELLHRLGDRIGRPALIIPTDDAGAIFLAEHGDELRPQFLFPSPPEELPRRLAGKATMHRLCRELGVPTAAIHLPDSRREVDEFVDLVGLPVLAKLTRPWSADRRARLRSTTLVHDRRELAELYSRSRLAGTPPGTELPPALMLQEYIPPPHSGQPSDWFFHGYCDARSQCTVSFTGLKHRSYPPHAGLTSFGRSVPNERLRCQAEELLARLSYKGIMDLDFRWDVRDDQYKLLDFNPRIGAQFRLFVDTNGIDVARAAHLDLTFREQPKGTPIAGRSFLVENYDPIAALRYCRHGELSIRTWLRTIKAVDETAWFARDDIAPFGLMCLRMAWRVGKRALLNRRASRASEPLAQSPQATGQRITDGTHS
jgi:D-aspartate ligase